MSKVLAAAAAASVALAGAARAATVGATLTINTATTDSNVPRVAVTNDSDSADITRFTLTIGNPGFNYDGYRDANFTAVDSWMTNIDTNLSGGGSQAGRYEIADIFDIVGLNPTESVSFEIDVDRDFANTVENFRNVLWNNGAMVANAIFTVYFSDDTVLSTVLDDDPVARAEYTFSVSQGMAPVPVPGAALLMAPALAGLGFARRRKAKA